jgi:hypothetical protein
VNNTDKTSNTPIHIDSTGPWPFISRHVFLWPTGEQTLFCSRHYRKGLYRVTQEARLLWVPEQLNWWIGIGFSLGALLFMLGSILVLIPSISRNWPLGTNSANILFFAGSIPFTIAAYLQLFQAANAGVFAVQTTSALKQRVIFGWYPHQIGWLSCALQFIGTLLFNINTFDGMLPQMDWLQQDLAIWVPDFVGSILFLVSGYLAFIETCHAYWSWNPDSLSWWVTYISFLGCVAFMISALFSYVPASGFEFDATTISVVFTLVGGACFFVGALLMLPETAQIQDTKVD